MTPQIACDRCTLGVMDADNPHLKGLCRCECHSEPDLLASYDRAVTEVENLFAALSGAAQEQGETG